MLSDAAVAAIQAGVKTEEITVDDISYLTRQVYLPPCEPMPGPVIIHTLTGLIEFVNNVADKKDIKAIHVAAHDCVNVLGPTQGRYHQRATPAIAEVKNQCKFRLDHFMPLEEFIIGLMTGFVQSALAKELLSILGNIKDEAVKERCPVGASDDPRPRMEKACERLSEPPEPERARAFWCLPPAPFFGFL